MFYPKFQILLNKESFYPEEAICLGTQLITIIDYLGTILKPHIWYAADVDAFSIIPSKFGINSYFLKNIGNDLSLVKICSQIDQFLSGVFLAIGVQNTTVRIENLQVGTEDGQYRSLNIQGVLVEIRAFDTSFFEIYSDDENIIKQLAERFGVEIIHKVNNSKQVNE